MNKGFKVFLPLLLCVTLASCDRGSSSIVSNSLGGSTPPPLSSGDATSSVLPSSSPSTSLLPPPSTVVPPSTNVPPLSTPSAPPSSVPPSSIVVPPSTSELPPSSVIPPSSSVEDDYATPVGRFSIFSKASAGEYTYIIGYPISYGEFEYTGKCNVYVQDGSFSYQVTNVPVSDFQIGKGYMFYGKKQISPVYGARISYDSDSSTYEVKKEDGYGLVDPIIPESLPSLGGDQKFPALLNIKGSILINKDNLNLSGSFDINSFTISFSGKEVVVEVRKALLEGLKLIQYLNEKPLNSVLNFGNIFFFSDKLACINQLEDIILDDQLSVDSAFEQLELPEVVTNDLQLLRSLSGASISWVSNDENVVTNSGTVTRPTFGEEDALVTLTATITRGGAVKVKTFVMLVAAHTSPVVEGQEPYISVYQEGSGSNKLIGIYNPSSQAINLDGFSLAQYANGSGEAKGEYVYPFGDRLLPAKTTLYIYNLNGALYSECFIGYEHAIGLKNNVVDFNGNDAVALIKQSKIIDVIGVIAQSVMGGWGDVGGVYTQNQTIVRSSTVTNGNKVFTTSEWRFIGLDNLDFLK